VVPSIEEARAAVREQIKRGADWITLYPAGGYSFTAIGQDQYQVTYPLPVLQALIDETHRLGKKDGSHVYGGEGQGQSVETAHENVGTNADVAGQKARSTRPSAGVTGTEQLGQLLVVSFSTRKDFLFLIATSWPSYLFWPFTLSFTGRLSA